MDKLSAHEQIRLKITAFLFNKRADALRGEMYKALCLHVLGEVDQPISQERVVELVAYALGSDVKVTDSLRTIVYDELRRLAEDEVIGFQNGLCSLPEKTTTLHLPNEVGEEALAQNLSASLQEIVATQGSMTTPAQLRSLLEFFLEAASLITQHQVGFLTRGYAVRNLDQDRDELTEAIQAMRVRYTLDSFVDADRFIQRTLIRPRGDLADFLYKLVQVNVIARLLAWDPDLEYLRKTILADKVLYLDSSALFVLMQEHHPLHHFLIIPSNLNCFTLRR